MTQDYCTAVRVVSGQCASWGSTSYDVTDQTKAAGYYNVTKEEMLDAIIAEHRLSSPFASFTIGPGDVAVVDGFFAEYPNSDFATSDCRRSGVEIVRCPLKSISMARLKASVDVFLRGDFTERGYPKLADVVKAADYKPTQINAEQGGGPSKWGVTYTLPGSVR